MPKTRKPNRGAQALDKLTAQLVEAMENNPGDWLKPWTSGGMRLPENGTTGRRYNGVNVMLLWGAAADKGYATHQWATFKQWEAKGCTVRKGERSEVVVFFKPLKITERQPDGTTEEKRVPILRYSSVFAAEQVDGEYAAGLVEAAAARAANPNPPEAIDHAREFFTKVGAEVRHVGASAYYTPALDVITLPPLATFKDAPSYYGTAAHEHVHWTGHADRLDRKGGKRFGDDPYAREELVAELGAAFVMAHLGLVHHTAEEHAQYLGHWVATLKQEPRSLFAVIGQASAALGWMLEQAGELPTTDEEEDQEQTAAA